MLNSFLKTIIPDIVIRSLRQFVYNRRLKIWKKKGCPVPPPHIVKQNTIKQLQKANNIEIFIETGTFRGEMVEAQKHFFKKVFSIELAEDFYLKAKQRFRKDKNVTILQGDSGKILTELLPKISKRAIFWLDGHYSSGDTAKGEKECPIFEELNAIFNGKIENHIIIIDDARLFIGKDDYPTIDELNSFIKQKNHTFKLEVKNDIICIVN